MFTGIVERVGTIASVADVDGDLRFSITASLEGEPLALGESIAVAGACLTVADVTPTGFEADVSNETASCTTLGSLAAGARVNLERSIRAGDRLGGHWVSGHVDAVGTMTALTSDARSTRMTFEMPEVLAPFVAAKGSVCIDGVSLTVNGVQTRTFDVNIIPHTLSVTTLAQLAPGDPVNLEADVIARYLDRLRRYGGPSGSTHED